MPTVIERIQEMIQTKATEKPKVAMDTCCVQYYLSNPPVQPWADCLDPIFRVGVEGKIELYVSTVVVSELLTHVHFANREKAGYDPELDLLAILNRHFQILDVDGAVARAAGRLRGNYVPDNRIALKMPDALIGATSLANGHTLFVTNDAQLANALPASNCIYLRDLALEWLGQNYPAACLGGTGSVTPSRSGKGLPSGVSIASIELGGIRPVPSANWRRILKEAQTIAAVVNESCAFFILSTKNGRKVETEEVLFWHEGLKATRPPDRIFGRLKQHLEIVWDKGEESYKANPDKMLHGVFFCFMEHEQARQKHFGSAPKSSRQKEADSWNGYLSLWRVFRPCLELPQVTWLLCEDGAVRVLDPEATTRFLDQAKNVLGWGDET